MILFSQGCEKNYSHDVYEIEISECCVYNDSVGNEWDIEYSCYGSTVYNGYCWKVPIDSTDKIYLDISVVENDKHPDKGKESVVIKLTDGFETAATITVLEGNGRYKDNKATWKITFTIKLVDKL